MIKLIGFKKRSAISFTRQVAGLAIISAVITLIAGGDKRMKKHEIKKGWIINTSKKCSRTWSSVNKQVVRGEIVQRRWSLVQARPLIVRAEFVFANEVLKFGAIGGGGSKTK